LAAVRRSGYVVLVTHLGGQPDVLLGLAIGDMMGAATEFMTPARVREVYGELTGPVAAADGVFEAGEFTDDTQMALCLAAAYPRDEGLVARALWNCRDWLHSGPKDVGALTRKALASGGVHAWRVSGYQSCGNGALMRAAASVAVGARGEALLADAVQLGAITHADPRSLVACAVYCLGLESLSGGAAYRDAFSAALTRVATADWPAMLQPFGDDYVAEVVDRLPAAVAEVGAAVRDGVDGQDAGNSGYAVTTLQTALAHGHGERFADTILAVVSQGDDADTVGAVTGGILGARGLTPPEDWLAALHSARLWSAWPRPARGAEARTAMTALCAVGAGVFAASPYPSRVPPLQVRRLHPQVLFGRNPLFAVEVEALVAAGVSHFLDLREPEEWSGAGRLGQEAVDAQGRPPSTRRHLAVADGGAPSAGAISEAVDFVDEALARGGVAFVHCRAGVERTGAMLLAWWLNRGGDRESLRSLAPILAPLPQQERAVYDWARR
jgi:ADP-ribosyl-[dinitrogen reductase] hydrolase